MSATGKVGSGAAEKFIANEIEVNDDAPLSQTDETSAPAGVIGKGDLYVKIVKGDDIGFFPSGDMPCDCVCSEPCKCL